jgi:very-short-patch-repair endonuclease
LLTDRVADVSAGAETPLELAYVRDVERAHRLPTGIRQHRDPRSGHHRDVWYEQWQSVVELDGRLGHEGTGKFRDMALDNLGVLHGVWTLRFGWHDVRGQPCEVARQVARLLQRNGWTGSPRPCPRCRPEH